MASIPSDGRIRAFWHWFVSVVPTLERDFENAALHERLTEELERLGSLTWELGPGLNTPNALAVSPDGALEWLPATRRVIELAPVVDDWEFYPARPPKQWELQFSIQGVSGELVDVDARPWRYVLLRYEDGFDVVLEHTNTRFESDDDAWRASVIVVEGVVGELVRLTRIQDIEPVAALSDELSPKANRIAVLAKHLASLLH